MHNAIEEFQKGKNFISLKDENIPHFKNLISELTIQHNFIPKNINYFENEEKKEEERVEEDEKLKNDKKKLKREKEKIYLKNLSPLKVKMKKK